MTKAKKMAGEGTKNVVRVSRKLRMTSQAIVERVCLEGLVCISVSTDDHLHIIEERTNCLGCRSGMGEEYEVRCGE